MTRHLFWKLAAVAALVILGIAVGRLSPSLLVGLGLIGTLLVPDVGEVALLSRALGKTSPEDVDLKLFVSNTTPAEGDTAATYTEAAGGGYADKTLAQTDWTVSTSSGTTSATQAEQTFTFTGALTTNTDIYGYYVVSPTGSVLLWAERASAIFTPANNGDTYKVTPKIEAA